MPWEIIADFRRDKSLTPEQAKWGAIATGLTAKLYELEPFLRFRIRNLPVPTRPNVFAPLTSHDVPAALHERLEVPDPTLKVVRQYQCHTCKRQDGKPKWVPQMYLLMHKGHELTKSAPTGRVKIEPWHPNYRLFIGHPDRLKDLRGMMYSVALTMLPANAKDLNGYDAVMLLPSPTIETEEVIAKRVKRSTSAEEVIFLPSKPSAAVEVMLDWMKKFDAKALDGTDEEQEKQEIDAVAARMAAAQAHIQAKLQAASKTDSLPGAVAVAAKGEP